MSVYLCNKFFDPRLATALLHIGKVNHKPKLPVITSCLFILGGALSLIEDVLLVRTSKRSVSKTSTVEQSIRTGVLYVRLTILCVHVSVMEKLACMPFHRNIFS